MKHIWIICLLIAVIAFAVIATAHAQSGGGYDLTWNTVDGGGAMNATGGPYTLGGTIGQPDAGTALTGGEFTLVGGFWHDWSARFEVFLPLIVR